MVIISDLVYGEIEVTELVLIELMASAPLQRLKGVDQHGAKRFITPEHQKVNRYDHCVGVMLLLKKLGASVEEQIAGLLHDVPHTAFSHVIDWVFTTKNNAQDFHEKFFEKIVMNSEIPKILEKYSFDVHRVINESLFGLLERNAPDLCADRLDYTFRDYIAFTGGDDGRVGRFLSHLVVHGGEIAFDSSEVALEFANHYIWMDAEMWSDFRTVASFHFLAAALKIGLDTKVLSFDDLFLTDDIVMQKLRDSKNEEILENLSHLVPELQVKSVAKSEADINSIAKLRFVDPKVLLLDGSLKRVSELYSAFLEEIEVHRKRIAGGVHLKVLSK